MNRPDLVEQASALLNRAAQHDLGLGDFRDMSRALVGTRSKVRTHSPSLSGTKFSPTTDVILADDLGHRLGRRDLAEAYHRGTTPASPSDAALNLNKHRRQSFRGVLEIDGRAIDALIAFEQEGLQLTRDVIDYSLAAGFETLFSAKKERAKNLSAKLDGYLKSIGIIHDATTYRASGMGAIKKNPAPSR